MKKLLKLLTMLVLSFNLSCTKESIKPGPTICNPCNINSACYEGVPHLEVVDTCFNWPPSVSYGYSLRYPLFSKPCFNPQNPDEILIERSESSQNNSGPKTIWKYNLCTNEAEKFFTPPMPFSFPGYSRPNWGKNGWIVFADSDQRLWKVKDTGDSLYLLIDTLLCQFPIWFEDKIICWTKTEVGPTGVQRTLLLSKEGDLIDELPLGRFFAANNQKVAVVYGAQFNQIGYIDIQSNQLIELAQIDEFYGFSSIDWLDENHIFWTGNEKFGILNINTGELVIEKEYCENLIYLEASISTYNNKEILLTRAEKHFINDFTYEGSVNIVKYDIITGQERLLDL